ncbi:hypothetical protein MRX96_023963 [Rhipicephalus microplus]
MRRASRTCLPCPGRSLEAYSGFIPVDNLQDGSFSSYLFFLHIKSEKNSDKKPLLLWLQGGPGKSALHGQFLENGPLGMTFLGTLYKRRHTLLKQFNIIYLDQPVGAGYSFDKRHKYPSSLQEVSTHLMTFMRRFLRLFHEYKRRDFFIAGGIIRSTVSGWNGKQAGDPNTRRISPALQGSHAWCPISIPVTAHNQLG